MKKSLLLIAGCMSILVGCGAPEQPQIPETNQVMNSPLKPVSVRYDTFMNTSNADILTIRDEKGLDGHSHEYIVVYTGNGVAMTERK